MTQNSTSAGLTGPGVMLFSAAIFGYFGFATTWLTTSSSTGQFLAFVAIFEWTLKAGAIAFLASALLTFVSPLAGNALYALASALCAIAMAVVLVLDFNDKQHTVMHEVVLLIFVVWNLWGAWSSVREVMAAASQRRSAPREQFIPPQ